MGHVAYAMSVRKHGLLLLLLAAPMVATADHPPDPLFDGRDVLDVSIRAPISTLMDERPLEDYVEGTFTIIDGGEALTYDVGLRTRGRFRNQQEVCPFAPIRLNFRKSQTSDTLLDHQDKVKLVTHCKDNSTIYEEAVVAEYLAYRVFSLVTNASFRARMLRVTYVDTDRNDAGQESFAVMLESTRRLSKRLHAPTTNLRLVAIPDLVPEYAALAAVFQYFLGNTDYSLIAGSPDEGCCHNHELLGTRETGYLSIPYDFDMTGFVDAPHARPNARFQLRSVRDRLYRGRCAHNDYVPAAVARFAEKREEIAQLIDSEPNLRKRSRRRLLRFVDDFFEDVATPEDIRKNLTDDCI